MVASAGKISFTRANTSDDNIGSHTQTDRHQEASRKPSQALTAHSAALQQQQQQQQQQQ